MASGVKSQSEVTRQRVSTCLVYSMSIASMVMAMSVAFLPLVRSYCWIGWIAWSCRTASQPLRFFEVQLP